MLCTIFHCLPPVDIISGIFILVDVIVKGLVVLFFTKQHFVTIYVHQIRMAFAGKSKGVGLVPDPYLMALLRGTIVYIYRDRQPENLARFLGLIDDHLHLT